MAVRSHLEDYYRPSIIDAGQGGLGYIQNNYRDLPDRLRHLVISEGEADNLEKLFTAVLEKAEKDRRAQPS